MMTFQIKRVALIVMLFNLCTVSVVIADADFEKLKYIADGIMVKMPSTWRVVEEKAGAIPYGHYAGLKYEGSGGLLLVLEGDQNVFLHWEDKQGVRHKEPLAKEALELWIMPTEYNQSWKRFFVMKSPVPAERIYAGKKAKIYGYPTSRTPSLEQFDQKVSSLSAVTTSWPNSPQNTGNISWITWKEDIKDVMRRAE